jgi:hypothetical protein
LHICKNLSNLRQLRAFETASISFYGLFALADGFRSPDKGPLFLPPAVCYPFCKKAPKKMIPVRKSMNMQCDGKSV